MFTIGCHLSSAKGYLKMAEDAASIDGNTFQFFTRNPRGGRAKAIDPADVAAFRAYADEHGIATFLAHAPYIMNPAAAKPETRQFAIELLTDDLMRMENTPGQLYNMHPGCHVGQGAEVGIALIADALNQVLSPDQSTTLLLETMAGKGTEVGGRFEELAGPYIIKPEGKPTLAPEEDKRPALNTSAQAAADFADPGAAAPAI